MGNACTKDDNIEEDQVILRLNRQNKKLIQTAEKSIKVKGNLDFEEPKPKSNSNNEENDVLEGNPEKGLITEKAKLYKSVLMPDKEFKQTKMNKLSEEAIKIFQKLGKYSHNPKNLELTKKKIFEKDADDQVIVDNNDNCNLNINKNKNGDTTSQYESRRDRPPINEILKDEFPVILMDDGSTFQGPTKTIPETLELLPHKSGKMISKDGSLYEGEFFMGKKQGIGRLIDSGGECYYGNWIEDLAQGEGIYYFLDGSLYVGEFINGKFGGEGTEIWTDGSRFKGNFLDSLKHGFGKFKWNNGSMYEGNFVKGEIEGKGSLFLLSLGFYTWPDGRTYEGQWKDNMMNGQGIFKWKDGKKYIGEYIADKKHGYGEFFW